MSSNVIETISENGHFYTRDLFYYDFVIFFQTEDAILHWLLPFFWKGFLDVGLTFKIIGTI